jgi:methanol--5-hydroxybenzimidazolylcobamide Co-methyltransferase
MEGSMSRLPYSTPGEIVFGIARHPVTCGRGVVIGGGQVLPEVNFTLPPMLIREETIGAVRERFREMVRRICGRAVELGQEGIVLEFEHLYELTSTPEWGAAVTADLKEVLDEFHSRRGLRSALRVTVADIREKERPPRMRTGPNLETMLRSFEMCAAAGADILSIESTGGKELSDRALLDGDLEGIAYTLGVLAPRDMDFLWGKIVEIARAHRIVPGGDTACGFANTAMQLAHQNMLPRVLAAVVRLMTAPRSLVAIEKGATGPLKDCGYENPILKALTGVPISMEGKASACAHSSPLGNIAAAVCDLWSNESVQDVRLLGGYAPEVFAEVLVYDCRLMNAALRDDRGPILRDLFVRSDLHRDPQALMLGPDVVHEAARRIVEAGPDPWARTTAMARLAVESIRGAHRAGEVPLSAREEKWLSTLERIAAGLPATGEEMVERLSPEYRALFIPGEYGLG